MSGGAPFPCKVSERHRCTFIGVAFGTRLSPPRVRGRRLRMEHFGTLTRSIPACAGAPRWYFTAPSVVWVYPRVCGGTRGASCEVVPSHGLSPRVRGHLLAVCKGQADHRSISACAGAPTARSTTSARGTVYPRVCGGTAIVLRVTKTVMGLSSRVRGHRLELFDDVLVTRSIPACAGAPLTCLERSLSKRVYPRVCGGTHPDDPSPSDGNGLSPRVRGHHQNVTRIAAFDGSIPACAGAPDGLHGSAGDTTVYPRVCGGTFEAIDHLRYAMGLSPRVRGHRIRISSRSPRSWSIPACAGAPLTTATCSTG